MLQSAEKLQEGEGEVKSPHLNHPKTGVEYHAQNREIKRVLVAEHYGLTLLRNSSKTHDAVSKDGKYVQIKATQVNRISISSEPDYLMVIKLFSDGSWEMIYNGPGKPAWDSAGKKQKNGQRPICLSKLRSLMISVDKKDTFEQNLYGLYK